MPTRIIIAILLGFIIGFPLGYTLNSDIDLNSKLAAISPGIAILTVYLTHRFSKARDRIKEYESTYYMMNAICIKTQKISEIVSSSKKDHTADLQAPLISIDIYNVCSKELLDAYLADVRNLNPNKLFDSESIIAALDFKFHFELFVNLVQKYLDFMNEIDPFIDRELKRLQEYRSSLLKSNLYNEAETVQKDYNIILNTHFNCLCDSIETQYKILSKQSEIVLKNLEENKLLYLLCTKAHSKQISLI